MGGVVDAASGGGWLMDVVSACGCGIGRRGSVVEVDRYAIARRKLGYSMGLILEARGGHLSMPRQRFPFLHSKLRGKFSLGIGAEDEMSLRSYDDDQY